MNIQQKWLTLLFTATTFLCFSQSNDPERVEATTLNLKASYNSTLIYPGVRLGIESLIKSINGIKIKKSGERRDFEKEQFISVNLSWYHHPYFHDNIYLTGGWTQRRTNSKGFFTEFSPEIGLSRTILGGTTYSVDNSGYVSIEKNAGYFYTLVSIGGGVGYDFSKTKMKPFMIFYKLNLISMFPYNSTIYLRPAMEIGMIYKLSSVHLFKTK